MVVAEDEQKVNEKNKQIGGVTNLKQKIEIC
jgi:hypothetical protein